MAKPTQTSFLKKRPIPQMPKGYYSGDQPNPNLRRFVEEHATTYDPASDDYHVPPFDKPIKTTKATAIYNMHTYWSKKPHDAIRQYIRHYTQPGDIVLDPFCGSGGTALAALMEGRTAIAIDRSPAATFITKNYCTPVDVDELQTAFEELKAKVKSEMDWLYETRCDRCDGRATTAYTVYSYVFQCNRCLNKVPLFDCVEAAGQTQSGKPKKISACPYCHANGHTEEISVRNNQRFDPVPVLVSYLCEEGCKPQRDQRRHDDPNDKKRAYFEQYDLGKLREIEAKPIPHWVPPHRMMNVESDTEPWGDKWRAGTSSFRTVAELYTKRNLWALAAIRDVIFKQQDSVERDKLLFAFQGIVLINSMMCEAKNTQITKGTYYLPQVFKQIYPLSSVESKVKVFKKAGAELHLQTTDLMISTDSATNTSDIPSNSIDYIFTDPPYAGNVQYGELNFVWEAWLDFDTKWHGIEVVVNRTRGITDIDWSRLMYEAMSECFRVLKPDRWLSLCYHDTSEGTWQLVQDLMTEVGFIPENTETALYIDAGQKSFNQLIADKVTRRDLVINFRKPRPGEVTQLMLFGDEDPATFSQKARAILAERLEQHPGSTADRLYDELVSRMVRKGEFERHNFDDLLHSVAEDVEGRWYLLETAGQLDEAESAREAAAAARLEAFMWERLASPLSGGIEGGEGVHYSDLFEQYLPVHAERKPRRLLQEWLPEFFFKTGEGTWRPPANEEERGQKAALRAGGTLRRIKRFTKALLDGVPPHDRDRPPNPATAADWLRQCRRAGLYELGRAIYEKGGFDFEALDDEAAMEVEEDYQICVRRSH
jgi:DNA modification methylase